MQVGAALDDHIEENGITRQRYDYNEEHRLCAKQTEEKNLQDTKSKLLAIHGITAKYDLEVTIVIEWNSKHHSNNTIDG